MSDREVPLLAEAYPSLVTYLEAALITEGEPSLARIVHELRFYGGCKCKSSCNYLLTAPAGDRDNAWIHLDDEEPRVWLQLNHGHTSFAGMEILEFDLGPVPAACQNGAETTDTGRQPAVEETGAHRESGS